MSGGEKEALVNVSAYKLAEKTLPLNMLYDRSWALAESMIQYDEMMNPVLQALKDRRNNCLLGQYPRRSRLSRLQKTKSQVCQIAINQFDQSPFGRSQSDAR